MKNPNPNAFWWQVKCFQVCEARLSQSDDEPIPLVGITSVTFLVLAPCGTPIPSPKRPSAPLKPNLFQALFTCKDHNYKNDLDRIELS